MVKTPLLLWLEDIKMDKFIKQFESAGYNLERLMNKKMNVNDFKFLGSGIRYKNKVTLMKAANQLNNESVLKYKQKVSSVHDNAHQHWEEPAVPPPAAFGHYNDNIIDNANNQASKVTII